MRKRKKADMVVKKSTRESNLLSLVQDQKYLLTRLESNSLTIKCGLDLSTMTYMTHRPVVKSSSALKLLLKKNIQPHRKELLYTPN